MNFFDMSFADIFLEKHGKIAIDEIIKQIKKESSNKYVDDIYIEIIFKTALLEFFGLNDKEIKDLIEDFMPCQSIDIENIKSAHKYSIQSIQKYLKEVMDSLESNEK